MTVGQKIKLLRERDNISQVELGERINESKQTIYKYENDIIKNIPTDKIIAIAKVFDVDPDYLFGIERNDRREYSFDDFKKKCLTDDEQLLLEGFRSASLDRQQDMLDMARRAIQGKKSSDSVHEEVS